MIDINDYRKHRLAQAEAKQGEAPAPVDLLPQAETDAASTGDDKFDKLIRVYQERVNEIERNIANLAAQGMGATKEEDVRKCQIIYAFHQGMIKAYKDAAEVPARILTEAKG